MSGLIKYLRDHRTDVLIIFFTVSAIGVSNYVWLCHEKVPPHWDMGRHLWTSLLYFNLLHWNHFYRLWTNYYFYPPFRYWVTLPFYLLFGTSLTTAVMSNLIFIAILAFSVYETGRMLWGRSTGLLAMLGILCSPMFIGQFKEYQLDAPLAAMAALSFCLLLKAQEFSNKKYSIWFGVSFGLGMLTKWTFIGCLLLPLIYSASKCVRANGPHRKAHVNNLWLAAFFALGVSLIWYGNHPAKVWEDFFGFRHDYPEAPMPLGELSTWYLQRFEQIQMYFIPAALFFIGFIVSLFRKSWLEKNVYPYLFVAGCYLFFTILKHDIRYSMPMLVGCFIFTVYWFELIKPKWLQIILKIVFIFYCCITYAVISAGTNLFPAHLAIGPVVLFDQSGYGVGAPDPTDWHQEEVFQIISQDPTGNKETAWIGPSPDHIRFNNWGIVYYALRYSVTVVNNVLGGDFTIKPGAHPAYVLERTFQKIDSYPGYDFYRQYVLPDQSFLYLFKRRG